MSFDVDIQKFNFNKKTFSGKRVLITGSGKNGGLGPSTCTPDHF